jgi:hypothetical protein
MPVCPSGSEPKVGTPRYVIAGEAFFRDVLGGAYDWLRHFIAPINGLPIDTDVLCGSEPPDPLTLSAEDLLALREPLRLGLFQVAVSKLTALVLQRAWYEYCQCSGASTPAAPAIQAEPADAPNVDPPNLVGPCAVRDQTCTNSQFGGKTFSNDAPCLASPTVQPFAPLPAGATMIRIIGTHVSSLSADGIVQFYVNVRRSDGTGLTLTPQPVAIPRLGTKTQDYAFAAGTYVDWQTVGGTASGGNHNTETMRLQTEIYCGNLPGQLQQACCPPDPVLLSKLDQALALLTLVQRQHVPFAYVPGLTYAGLSGNGEVTFSDPILRLKLELTTLPGNYGLAEGHPDQVYDVGTLAIGTADGFEPPQWITNSPMLLQVPGDAVRIGYALRPGVVATITTYSREP